MTPHSQVQSSEAATASPPLSSTATTPKPAPITKAITSTTVASTHPIPAWVGPDLSRLMIVEHPPGEYTSRAVSLISLPAGAIFARITSAVLAPEPRYSTVQISPTAHIELNSDLLYLNHSCSPSVVMDVTKWEVRVAADRDLRPGDELTFFYPSSEWDMARPFACRCGADVCKGTIGGASRLSRDELKGYWLNAHIEELLMAQEGSTSWDKNA